MLEIIIDMGELERMLRHVQMRKNAVRHSLTQLPSTLNQYAYCWNGPLNLVDLDGQWPSLKGILNRVNTPNPNSTTSQPFGTKPTPVPP